MIFSKDADVVHNQIRGLSPIPVAFTKTSEGKILKVTKSHTSPAEFNGESGEVVSLDGGIFVKCGNGTVVLDEVIPEGKGKMSAASFINGRKIQIGDILGK